MLTYGQVKEWRPGPMGSSGEGLGQAITRFESARDKLEEAAVPDSWGGLSRFVAETRRDVLVASMDRRIETLRTLRRAFFAAESSITSLRRSVQDVEGEAAAKQFTISSDGGVTSTADPPTFDSRWEAEEWSDIRQGQATALAEQVGRIVDRAVEIDSALCQAIPYRDDESDLRGFADPGVAQRWGELTDAQRQAVLTQIVREELGDLDLDPPPTVTFVDPNAPGVDSFYTDHKGAYGVWSADRNEIYINPLFLDDPRRIGTAAHEARHARQSDAVDDLDGNVWEDLFGPDPFDKHEDAGVTREEAEDWEENFQSGNYISEGDPKPGGGYYSAEDYQNQPVEEDAFENGSDYLDDLTPEELERLLEESQ